MADANAELVKLTPRPPQAWQCSGCRRVYFGRLRHTCPGCGRFGYWTASVETAALKAGDAARERTPEEQAYDVVAEAIADRDRLRALLAAYGRAVEERREDVAADALLDIEDEAAKWREWG